MSLRTQALNSGPAATPLPVLGYAAPDEDEPRSPVPPTLRPYQVEAIAAVEKLTKYQERVATIVGMATGLGKTAIACQVLKNRGPRGLVLVHRDELVRQTVTTLETFMPDCFPGVVQAEDDEWDADWVVASVQSLRERRLRRWHPGHFRTVVVDEAHHGRALTYERILEHLRAPLVLGLTATPYRGDKQSLEPMFKDNICYSYAAPEGIQDGWLVDPKGYRPGTDVLLDGVRSRGGDFVEGELSAVVDTPGRNRIGVEAWRKYAMGMRTVAFCASVDHAHHLAFEFRQRGIAAVAISGATPRLDRRAHLDAFRSGELKVICNCMVLTEGYDETSIECILMARPTQSLGLWTQMVGRGLRTHPGKTGLLLIDLADTTNKHKLVGLHTLVGSKVPLRDGVTLRGAIAEEESGADTWVAYARRLRKVTEEVGQMWVAAGKQAVRAGGAPELDWREMAQEFEALRDFEGGPSGILNPSSEAQQKALRGFGWPAEVAASLNKREASMALSRFKAAHQGWIRDRIPMLALTLGEPEQRVHDQLLGERTEAEGDRRGLWQLTPASERQIRFLQYRRLPDIPGLTMGEASLLIDHLKQAE
ncbi:MAG: DEAD/DEAH box helicase [Candidatus Dormibacteria bacterium]